MKRVQAKELLISELQEINERLKRIEASCEKMERHISFVDNVYEKVKSPFHWLMEKARSWGGIGGSAIELSKFAIKPS